jgi:shikimate kinase
MQKHSNVKSQKNTNKCSLSKQVILLGMMGVGKTTFGRKAAARLNVPFIDIDHEIEADIGHSVAWIFDNAGEEEFRKLESNKIEQVLSDGKPKIIGLGGGAFISTKNRNIIKNYGAASVWLTASPETIYDRVKHRKDRPLLENCDNKMMKIKEIMSSRNKFYSQADHKISTDEGNYKRTVDDLINLISGLG